MKLKQEDLTQEIVKEWLTYDPESGVFTLNKKTHSRDNTRDLNTPLGYKDGRGYIHFSFLGKKYKAHRLAWFYVFGKWPAVNIDHINGIRHDNRICNLREATALENSFNRHTCNSKTGHRGVYESKNKNNKVVGYIAQYDKTHLGYFRTIEQAADVVNKLLLEKGGEYARQDTLR